MTTLMKASNQWMSRPDDERFTSLDDLLAHVRHQRSISTQAVEPVRSIEARPIADDPKSLGIVINGNENAPVLPTHWSFGQLASLGRAPAGYLRTLPSDLTADCLNTSLRQYRNNDRGVANQIGLLTRVNGESTLAAATGPAYGRIWNADVAGALRERFGDGVTGDFTVPGEFGVALDSVTKANTTLYASDRDMFVFLADETNRIEVPGRRNGRSGSMARGFFVWNSEVGSSTFGVATFLFDYVCCNRIVWGADGYEEIRIRHTSGAPDRWIHEVAPAIEAYAQKSTTSINTAIADARSRRIDDDKLDEFLARRFTRNQAQAIKLAHRADEDRPIETMWDAVVGATAYARNITHQDERVAIERIAGKILTSAS